MAIKWTRTNDDVIQQTLRSIELEVGQVKRRQSALMDWLRETREILMRIERAVEKHDRWERDREKAEAGHHK